MTPEQRAVKELQYIGILPSETKEQQIAKLRLRRDKLEAERHRVANALIEVQSELARLVNQ